MNKISNRFDQKTADYYDIWKPHITINSKRSVQYWDIGDFEWIPKQRHFYHLEHFIADIITDIFKCCVPHLLVNLVNMFLFVTQENLRKIQWHQSFTSYISIENHRKCSIATKVDRDHHIVNKHEIFTAE